MIKRILFEKLIKHLSAKEISLIVGPRQSGKTTLMKELLKLLQKEGEQTVFLNLDYEADRIHFLTQDALINKLRLDLGFNGGYVFIDEIQRKENAGLFLKGIYDLDIGYKFIVSGSGSLELKEKIHESLAGRKRLFELNTVSFEEFVNYKTSYKYEKKLAQFFKVEKGKTLQLLTEFMGFGGYPRVVVEDNINEKIMIIDEIYRSYVEKDISFLLKVDKTEAFTRMMKLLAAQAGSLINYSVLAMNSGVSVPTVKKYLWYAEKTFIIKEVLPFFTNKLKEITKSPTVYFNDLGMRNYMIGAFGNLQNPTDIGLVFQNVIYNILYEKYLFTPTSINFWRTIDKAEVDFIIKKANDLIPVEVKYSSFNKPVLTRSFHSFIEKYCPKEAFLISCEYEDVIKVKKTIVKFIPFYQLLFEDIATD